MSTINRYAITAILGLLLGGLSLRGQCPRKDSLWARIYELRFSTTPFATQLEELLEMERRVNSCPDRRDSITVILLQRIGFLYSAQREFDKAVQYTRLAIQLNEEGPIKPYLNTYLQAKNYNNIKIYYDSLGLNKLRIAAVDSCIAISTRYRSGTIFAMPEIENRVVELMDAGEYQRAIDYTLLYESAASENSNTIDTGLARVTCRRVTAYLLLKDFNRAWEILESLREKCMRPPFTKYLGTVYEQMAEVAIEEGRLNDAEKYFDEAFQNEKMLGFRDGCAQILNNKGYYFYFQKKGDYSRAMSCYRLALQYASETEALNLYDNMANLAASRQKFDSAKYYFRKAYSLLGRNMNADSLLAFSNEQFREIKKIQYLSGMLVDEADASLKEFRDKGVSRALDEAIRLYQLADRLLDRIKRNQVDIQSKLSWRQDTRRLYEHAIEACYLKKDPELAFLFFEKGRAAILNDQLLDKQRMSDADILRQAQLQSRIRSLNRQLNAVDSASELAEIRQQLFAAQSELDRMEQRLRQSGFDPFDDSLVTVGAVRKYCRGRYQGLVEFFIGTDFMYVLAIRDSALPFIRMPRMKYDSLALPLMDWLASPARLNQEFGSFVETSNNFYKQIWEQLKLPPGRVIVSPDGYCLPVEVLVTRTGPGRPAYLLEQFAVSYTYSARQLMRKGPATPVSDGPDFFGVAPVHFSAQSGLPALPGSEQSLKRISNGFGSHYLEIGNEATRSAFLDQFSRSRIAQLFTHASDSSTSTGEPVIFFSDSALLLSDLISGVRPSTALIVLSACQTGTGKLYRGEGVFSFDRSFAALGIPAAISNLWNAEDRSSYAIIEKFYTHLREGDPKDVALQKAKLEFLKEQDDNRQLPAFWAAAILTGDAEPVSIHEAGHTLTIVLIIVGALLAIALLWWFLRRKRLS